MALEKKKISEIPSDAIILTEDEALKYQIKLLNTWKVPSDVFAFKYGVFVLGNAAALTGIFVNHYYRKVFKLGHYGRVSSYVPVASVPALLAFMLHEQLVLKNVMLLKQNECPVCLEIRASAVQATVGFLIPFITGPIFSLSLVHKYYTYNIPYLSKEPMKVLKLLGEKSKPIKNISFIIFVAHALLGSVVTYFEANSMYNVNLKLNELATSFEKTT